MSRKRREIYFANPGQNLRSHAQHKQLYRAILERDPEKGERILRQHLKGVDAYFRMFFSDPKKGITTAVLDKLPAKSTRAPAKEATASAKHAKVV